MKILSTRAHGIMDYLVGLLLIAAPFILDFDRGGAETWVPVIVGVMILLQNMATNWEVGIFRALPASLHLTMDYLIGIFLAASPWLFGFSDYVYLPHLLVGIMILMQAMMTRTVPDHGAVSNRGINHGHSH